jgi:transcriptional regulator with XRE-family HTH domain
MAREVRALRKEYKLTQKQLAAVSGINQGEISRIERGQTNPTATTLAALLAPLNARLGVVTREQRDARYRLKPWQFGVGVLNQLREHIERPHPDGVAIFDRPINGQQLFRLGVMRHAEEFVLTALEVAIQAWSGGSLRKRRSLSGWHETHDPSSVGRAPRPDALDSGPAFILSMMRDATNV